MCVCVLCLCVIIGVTYRSVFVVACCRWRDFRERLCDCAIWLYFKATLRFLLNLMCFLGFLKNRCPKLGLNQRPSELRSNALPAEILEQMLSNVVSKINRDHRRRAFRFRSKTVCKKNARAYGKNAFLNAKRTKDKSVSNASNKKCADF